MMRNGFTYGSPILFVAKLKQCETSHAIKNEKGECAKIVVSRVEALHNEHDIPGESGSGSDWRTVGEKNNRFTRKKCE